MSEELIKKESPFKRFQINASGSAVIFYTSATIFLITAASYGGLFFFNKNLGVREPILLEEIRAKEVSLREDLKDILLLETRLKNLKELLVEHPAPSRIIDFLETNTHPQVRFFSFVFSAAEKSISLGAEAASYATVAQQVIILEQNPEVQKIEFGGLSFNETENKANFRLKIFVNPSLIQFQPETEPAL